MGLVIISVACRSSESMSSRPTSISPETSSDAIQQFSMTYRELPSDAISQSRNSLITSLLSSLEWKQGFSIRYDSHSIEALVTAHVIDKAMASSDMSLLFNELTKTLMGDSAWVHSDVQEFSSSEMILCQSSSVLHQSGKELFGALCLSSGSNFLAYEIVMGQTRTEVEGASLLIIDALPSQIKKWRTR